MSLLKRYHKALRGNNLDVLIDIEEDNDLCGLPPELVCVGLSAIDQGDDPWEAIDAHTGA